MTDEGKRTCPNADCQIIRSCFRYILSNCVFLMVSFVIWRKRSLALIRHNAAQLCSLATFIGTKPCNFGKRANRHCATFPSGEGLHFVKRCLEKISFGLFLQSAGVQCTPLRSLSNLSYRSDFRIQTPNVCREPARGSPTDSVIKKYQTEPLFQRIFRSFSGKCRKNIRLTKIFVYVL